MISNTAATMTDVPQKKQRVPLDNSTPLSCYSFNYPPEQESLVVVQVNRVDDTGIWGVLTDWGHGRCTAYLPMGSIGKEKGRGERKAQMHFLTRARRSISKRNDHRMTFVAYVQEIASVSQSGVADCPGGDIGAQRFHITVTRRGISGDIEKVAMALSTDVQHCGRLLVDKAATMAKVSNQWARKVTMHKAYERALVSSDDDDEPDKAPVVFLLKRIGGLEAGNVSAVAHLLGIASEDNPEEDQIQSFASHLLTLCLEEKDRRSKPANVSVSASIGGPKVALQSHEKGFSPTVCDTHHLIAAFQAVDTANPPQGCGEVSVAIKGNGKYTLTTTSAPDLESTAQQYLNGLSTSLQEAWMQSSSSDHVYGAVHPKQDEKRRANLQPTLSIGVIGDVANGKSTLVKAISGKKTQSHSSEQQQHGITIRLGFANAAVLQCQNPEGICGACSFLPESMDGGKDASLPKCSKCGISTSVVRRFSLVDCPGHAELMATMLAGASSFDAVLLTAASNVPCPTPQAKQHLEAIKMSGIMSNQHQYVPSIAIAQTKAELLTDSSKDTISRLTPEERLEHHANHGRDNMKKAVAATAPIFPVCAPLGLGLDAVAEWIAKLPPSPLTTQQDAQAPHLTVLRSFDVNRPGQPAKEMSGGVLGGTIQGGGSISLGDVLEVRPGICLPRSRTKPKGGGRTPAEPVAESKKSQWLKKKVSSKVAKHDIGGVAFQVQPLHFQCTSLMTGKNSLSSASKGGLVAVGTSLDPLLCADNRMVGSTVGPPGTLPPVWGPCLYLGNLQVVDILPETGEKKGSTDPSDLLKKGSEMRCHIGSATVKGRVVRISMSAGKVELCLDGPVCVWKGANVALEGKGGNGFCLVAHAKLADGDVCLEGAAQGWSSDNDEYDDGEASKLIDGDTDTAVNLELIERDARARKRFLLDLELCTGSQSDTGSSRLSVPRADIARDGGAHIVLSNFGLIVYALRRETSHLILYLQKEGGLSCVLAGDRTSPAATMLRVKWRGGRNFAERFTSILKKYVRAYVTCNQCRGAVTELLGVSKMELCCRHCNAKRFVLKL